MHGRKSPAARPSAPDKEIPVPPVKARYVRLNIYQGGNADQHQRIPGVSAGFEVIVPFTFSHHENTSHIPYFTAAALLGSAAQAAPKAPQLTETPEQREERIQWFRDAKFGLFIHWGPSAISGEEISWGMKDRIEGGGHHMKVPRDEYMNLYKQFNPVKWNPDGLFDLATDAGMKYVVFVTKHHDGFTMWPTKAETLPRRRGVSRPLQHRRHALSERPRPHGPAGRQKTRHETRLVLQHPRLDPPGLSARR